MHLERWSLDPAHSILGFQVRHLMISNVHGRFARWNGSFELASDDPTRSRVSLSIDAASIDTQEAQRDAHLRSAEFFDVEAFPTITFESTQIERRTLDDYEIAGDLTIRGHTRRVTLAVSRSEVIADQQGHKRVGFAIAGTLSRKELGLTWNS